MDVAEMRRQQEQRLKYMEAYLKSNFVPSIPPQFAPLALKAMDTLEVGCDPDATIYFTDAEIDGHVPHAAWVDGPNGEGWRMACVDLLFMLHLENSLTVETINKLNARIDQKADL